MKSKSANVEQRRRKKVKKEAASASNPFELRINKQKFNVLGRKSKHDRGLPGVSRSKAIKKRKETLLQEFKQRKKVSSFVDRRFGEYDNELSLEERMLKRFTLEKQKHHESQKLYNLDDEEELTHYGQSLGEMTNFDDADLKLTDDEENDQDKTGANNFGGFLKKVDNPQQNEEELKQKSKKEIMEEIVAKSKLKKMERQQAKEEAFQLTQDLDSDWKMIQGLLTKRDDEKRTKADDYDILVNELFYERKAMPKARLKTEEEIAQAEKEKLERLEAERLERMRLKEDIQAPHLSADFLGDSQVKTKDDRVELTFKDGKAVLPPGAFESVHAMQYKTDKINDGSSIDEEDDEDSEGDEVESEESEDDEGEEEESEGDEDDDSDDGEEEIHNDDDAVSSDDKAGAPSKSRKQNKKDVSLSSEAEIKSNEGDISYAEKMDTEANKELPFTFEAPETLQEFLEIVEKWSYEQQLCIIDRIRKCHPVKLEEKNKKKMETLFVILLKYIDQLCEQPKIPFSFINKLAKPLYGLVKDNPFNCTCEVQRRLRYMFKRFWMKHRTSGGRNAAPEIKEVLFLIIISKVYPVSDLKHGIVTPALTYLTAILSKAYFQTEADLISGLLLSNIILDFMLLSKRFVPEVVNFLSGVIAMATKPESQLTYYVGYACRHLHQRIEEHKRCYKKNLLSRKPSLRVHYKNMHSLALEQKCNEPVQKMNLSNLKEKGSEELRNLNTNKRVSILRTCVQMTKKFAVMYKELPSFSEIFAPAAQYINMIQTNFYPTKVKDEIMALHELLTDSEVRKPLTLLARKPIPLPLLEPKFDESYEVISKKRSKNKDENERNKLKYKFKSEMKGAIREIRKDSQFLAKEKRQEKVKRDAERRRKTKEIERQLAEQQGELKALDKMKKKKKR